MCKPLNHERQDTCDPGCSLLMACSFQRIYFFLPHKPDIHIQSMHDERSAQHRGFQFLGSLSVVPLNFYEIRGADDPAERSGRWNIRSKKNRPLRRYIRSNATTTRLSRVTIAARPEAASQKGLSRQTSPDFVRGHFTVKVNQ